MNGLENKIISASAGTGKTYRLSLEYIGLLLKYYKQGIHYSEMLVITFTKKATSEIRERIFEHLHHIIRMDDDGKELLLNLQSILGLQISDKDRSVLKRIYEDMLVNKNKVRISTIDAFTNEIFKTIIAPYLGIANYEIENTIHDDVFAEVFSSLMQERDPQAQQLMHDFFFRANKKTITDYQKFIESLLRNRWIFDFMDAEDQPQVDQKNREQQIDEAYERFFKSFSALLRRLEAEVCSSYPNMTNSQYFKMDFIKMFLSPADLDSQVFAASIMDNLDQEVVSEHHKKLLGMEYFWDGSKVFRGKAYADIKEALIADFEKCRKDLATFILEKELFAEQDEIRLIANRVFEKYDEIKFRDKRFTHSDVSYYTFKYLYDPDLSLIDDFSVTNAFYEYLTAQIRFILIDEFQDTSMIQYKILLPIINEITSGMGAKEYGGVIIVGDEKQSIYGWRGGERDLLLAMPSVLNECNQFSLNTSYRSYRRIMDFINDVFMDTDMHTSLDIHWPYDPVQVHKTSDDGFIQVQARNYANYKDDNNDISTVEDALREFVIQTLAPLLQAGQLDVKKTAVLARKNSDLKHIAAVLDELDIDYILESSGSILQHRTVVPLMMLFRFLVYQDVYDLLRFLRSDLVLMSPETLKQIMLYIRDHAKDGYSLSDLFSSLDSISALKKVDEIYRLAKELVFAAHPNLLLFTQKVIEKWNVTGIFKQENDLVNLNRFLEILAAFTQTDANYSLKGFLEYCQENEQNERFQQIGLKEYNAITLLTIHKSKGLEYDNVFLYWNLSPFGGNFGGEISYYLSYEQDFSHLLHYIYTLNYDHILELTEYAPLIEQKDKRDIIEELNNIYVALTRAKTNLYIQFVLGKKGGISEFIKDCLPDERTKIRSDRLLFLSVLNRVQRFEAGKDNTANKSVWTSGSFKTVQHVKDEKEAVDYAWLTDYLSYSRRPLKQPDALHLQRMEHIDLKSVYLKNRDIDKGNIIHYYLSYVHYGANEEFEFARKQTLGYFGNLLPIEQLESLMQNARNVVSQHPGLFDASVWDRVFTEYTLYTQSGKELRLDRMMIDLKEGHVEIIDYKTGEQYQAEQLDDYIQAVHKLPVVENKKYKVTGKYIEIHI